MLPELVLFDMDGTAVQYPGQFQSSWDALRDECKNGSSGRTYLT